MAKNSKKSLKDYKLEDIKIENSMDRLRDKMLISLIQRVEKLEKKVASRK